MPRLIRAGRAGRIAIDDHSVAGIDRVEITAFDDDTRRFAVVEYPPELEVDVVERKARRLDAIQRAEALLLAHLDDEQRKQFEASRRFVVQVRSGRRYLIAASTVGNVSQIDEQNRVIVSHCAYAPGVPLWDHMLAQKLVLQADERLFLTRAFTSDRSGHAYPQGDYARIIALRDGWS